MRVGQPVQYYDNGWRFGHIREIPIKGKHKGEARIEHPMSGLTWIPIADIKPV